MNLTIQSLNKIEDNCKEARKFKALLDAEDQRNLLDDIRAIENNLDAVTDLAETARAAVESLESLGYSDAWFNTVAADGKLEGLISFDMPKFFDNKVNRGKACMEGFIDGLKKFIMAAADFIIKLVKKLLSLFGIIIDVVAGDMTWDQKFKQWLNQLEIHCDRVLMEGFFRDHNISVYLYDLSSVPKMYENAAKIIDIIYSGNPSQCNPIADPMTYQSTITRDVLKEFFIKLEQGVAGKGMASNDMRNGFVLVPPNDGETSSKLIQFVSFNDMALDVHELKSFNDLKQLEQINFSGLKHAAEMFTRKEKDAAKNMRTILNYAQKLYNDAMHAMENGEAVANERWMMPMRWINVTKLCLKVVGSTMVFVGNCSKMNRHNRKQLIDVYNLIAEGVNQAQSKVNEED